MTLRWAIFYVCGLVLGCLLPELKRLLRGFATFVWASAYRKLREK